MKKISVFAFLLVAVGIFSQCSSSKKMASKKKLNYQNDIETIIMANCSPCHIPSKGGNKAPLDTYAAVTKNIDGILRRIQLNPTDRGFMPFRGKKLSDDQVNVFKQWKDDGLLEK